MVGAESRPHRKRTPRKNAHHITPSTNEEFGVPVEEEPPHANANIILYFY